MTMLNPTTQVDVKPQQITKLGDQTYALADGRRLTYWSEAPAFPTRFAVPSMPGMPWTFVWLYDETEAQFVHAVVSVASDRVLAVGGFVDTPRTPAPVTL